VTGSIPIVPSATLFQRIKDKGELEGFAVEMKEAFESLSNVFPDGVADGTLHFLVKLPLRTQAPGEFHFLKFSR
jgi:hypothetical protein